MESQTYDVVILDIMGVDGFNLLESAVKRNFRVAMLTAHALNVEALNRSFKMRAMAYLPKKSWARSFLFWKMFSSMNICPAGNASWRS